MAGDSEDGTMAIPWWKLVVDSRGCKRPVSSMLRYEDPNVVLVLHARDESRADELGRPMRFRRLWKGTLEHQQRPFFQLFLAWDERYSFLGCPVPLVLNNGFQQPSDGYDFVSM